MKRMAMLLLGVFVGLQQTARAEEGDARMVEQLALDARKMSNLEFPTEAKELGAFSTINNGLFRPEGQATGPFPALVVAHSCGGVRPRDMDDWLDAALKRGFVVLVVDSMRGNKNNCYPPVPVPAGRRLKDMYDASAHLARLPFVDPKRIYQVGFSQGAFLASLLASPQVHRAVAPESPRYAASAGLYGICNWPAGTIKNVNYRLTFVFDDSDRPYLMLMGAADRETPPEHCGDTLTTLQAKGRPVEWHVYPETTHCWDCISLDGFSKTDFRGERISYRYDKQVSADSRRRVLDFFERHR